MHWKANYDFCPTVQDAIDLLVSEIVFPGFSIPASFSVVHLPPVVFWCFRMTLETP